MPSYTFTKNRQLKPRHKNKALRAVLYVGAVLLFATVFVQLYVMSVYATQGHEVAKLEARKNELLSSNKALTEDIANARKLEYIKNRSQDLGYVDIKANDVQYLKIDQ